jgi:MarR family transcriptional regulator, organic hydroperoxide resistance regulator
MATHRVPSVGYLVWHLSTRWRVAVDRALAPLGITNADYSLLASLFALTRADTRPSQRELADFAGLEVMYVSKLVRSLEHSGLLRRNDHPHDPRAFELALTARGEALAERGAEVVRALYDQLLSPLGGRSSKRTAALMETLQSLLDHADEFNRAKPSLADRRARRSHRAARVR